MKKFMFFLMLCISCIAKAEEGTGSCTVADSGTVEATAFVNLNNRDLSGFIVVANEYTRPIVTLNFSVTADIVNASGNTVYETVTIYSGQKYFEDKPIAPDSSHRITLDKVKTSCNYSGQRIGNINVTIRSARCK